MAPSIASAEANRADSVMGSLYIQRFMGNVNKGNKAKIDCAKAAGKICIVYKDKLTPMSGPNSVPHTI